MRTERSVHWPNAVAYALVWKLCSCLLNLRRRRSLNSDPNSAGWCAEYGSLEQGSTENESPAHLHDVGNGEDDGAHIEVPDSPGEAQAPRPHPQGPPPLCRRPARRPRTCQAGALQSASSQFQTIRTPQVKPLSSCSAPVMKVKIDCVH